MGNIGKILYFLFVNHWIVLDFWNMAIHFDYKMSMGREIHFTILIYLMRIL